MATRTIPTPPQVDTDVFGMAAATTLGFIVQQRRRQDTAAAEEMRAVTHWADLHRTDSVIGAAIDPDIALTLPLADCTLGHEGALRLAGQGAFTVEEFAVCELAAGLCMSEIAARAYLGQSLELRDRLPMCWGRVMSGRLPAWKGRQIAEHTIALAAETAAYVDAQLAAFAHRLSVGRILQCVDAAILRFEPELAAARAEVAADKRGVWREDCAGGVSELHAVGDTPDIDAFDETLDRVAATAGRLGDTDSHQARRAKALRILADPQYALDLLTDPGTARPTPSGRPATHIHLHADSLAPLATGASIDGTAIDGTGIDGTGIDGTGIDGTGIDGTGQPTGVARVDGLGPVALEAIRRWLADLAPGSTVKLTPLVDLTEHLSVDAYEIPDRLRDQIEHRDLRCVFPWCGRRGRFDLDHIEPFDFGDPQTGRPSPRGQTNTANLSRLCRFHHRVKTHSEWTYRRRGPTAVEWTSPHDRRYRVDHTGTRDLN